MTRIPDESLGSWRHGEPIQESHERSRRLDKAYFQKEDP